MNTILIVIVAMLLSPLSWLSSSQNQPAAQNQQPTVAYSTFLGAISSDSMM